jgi:hypothetical protein
MTRAEELASASEELFDSGAATDGAIEPLSEVDGSFRDLIATRSVVVSKPIEFPSCWYESVRWLETYGYMPTREDESVRASFLRGLLCDTERLHWFLQLSIACCLYFYARHERTRILYSLPEPLRMPTLCRFEELRVHAVPSRDVSEWAVAVLHLCADELQLGSRLSGYSFMVGAFAVSCSRELRCVLQQSKVSEAKVMSMTRIAPEGVGAWYEQVISGLCVGGNTGD